MAFSLERSSFAVGANKVLAFNYSAAVKIGGTNNPIGNLLPIPGPVGVTAPVVSPDPDGPVTIQNLDDNGFYISFSIQNALDLETGEFEVQVANLSQRTRDGISERVAKFESSGGTPTSIHAGYGGRVTELFSGRAYEVRHIKQTPGWMTVIRGADFRDVAKRKVEVKLSPGTPLANIVTTFAATLGIKVPPATLAALGSEPLAVKKPFIYDGPAIEFIEFFAEAANMPMMLGPEGIIVVNLKVPPTDNVAVVGPSSGLISEPQKIEAGLQFDSLINPNLQAGRGVTVLNSNGEAYGERINVITEVAHSGDTNGGEWRTSATIRPWNRDFMSGGYWQ